MTTDARCRRWCAWTLLLAAAVGAGAAHAGPVIRGTVRDAGTGEGLAAATVQVAGTYRGTIANEAGDYALEVDVLPATLHVTHIGYASMSRAVLDTATLRLDFDLDVAPYRLPEMIVTPDMAADLMRRVIARKAEWMPRLRSYHAEAYTRRTIDRGGEIIELHELVSDVYWDRERGTREVITSIRKTANADASSGMDGALEGTVNLYDDDIEFIESSLMGVTHPDALEHYAFDLIGRRSVDDRVVYDLSVRPRSRLHSGLEGTIAVLDGEFVLLEVDLQPTRAVLATAIPIPVIEGLTWHYRQQFRGFDGLWLPVDYRLDIGIEIGMIGLHFPWIGLQQVTRFADYDIDAALPDTLFAVREGDREMFGVPTTVRIDSAAVAADTAFTRFADPVPMTAAEVIALDTITAAYKGSKVLRPTGFLARYVDVEDGDEEGEMAPAVDSGGETGPSGAGRPWRRIAQWTPEGRFNRVEEALVALGARRDGPWDSRLRARGGFSSGLERWSFALGARRAWSDGGGRTLSVDAGWHRGAGSQYTSAAYPVYLNSAQALLGEDDYFDYYWNEGSQLDIGIDPQRWQATVRLGLRDEEHSSLASTTDRDLLGRAPLRPNPTVDDGHMRRVEVEAVLGGDYQRFGVVPNRRLMIEAEYSDGWMGSDFDYTRLHVEADWHVPTFLRRRWIPNALDLRLVGGTSTGDLPVQRFGALDVAMGPLSPWGVLRGAHGHPYVGEHHLGLVAEHNFRTAPFELLGLWPLVRRGFGLVVYGGYGQTWIDGERRAAMPIAPRWTSAPHEEVGVSLFLYNLARVDLTRRLDEDGWAIGASLARFEFD